MMIRGLLEGKNIRGVLLHEVTWRAWLYNAKTKKIKKVSSKEAADPSFVENVPQEPIVRIIGFSADFLDFQLPKATDFYVEAVSSVLLLHGDSIGLSSRLKRVSITSTSHNWDVPLKVALGITKLSDLISYQTITRRTTK